MSRRHGSVPWCSYTRCDNDGSVGGLGVDVQITRGCPSQHTSWRNPIPGISFLRLPSPGRVHRTSENNLRHEQGYSVARWLGIRLYCKSMW